MSNQSRRAIARRIAGPDPHILVAARVAGKHTLLRELGYDPLKGPNLKALEQVRVVSKEDLDEILKMKKMKMEHELQEILSGADPGPDQIVAIATDGEEVIGAYVKPKNGLGFVKSKPGSGVGKDLTSLVLRELQKRKWKTKVQVGVGNVKSLRHHALLGYRVKSFQKHPHIKEHPNVLLNGVQFDDLDAVNNMLDAVVQSKDRIEVQVDGKAADTDAWKNVPGMGTYSMDIPIK